MMNRLKEGDGRSLFGRDCAERATGHRECGDRPGLLVGG